MRVDETDARREGPRGRGQHNFALTNLATPLPWKGNANRNSQAGNHYHAHAHALGGADPLESRGIASVASPDKL
jgi:hypothetical protein